MSTGKSLGQVAYEAYREWEGPHVRDWAALPLGNQESWEFIGRAVAHAVVLIPPGGGEEKGKGT